MRQIAAKNTFFDCLKLSFAGTPNERSSRFQAPLGMVVANYAPAYTWEPPIADVMARAGACVVYNSILKFFEQNLANETTWKIGPLTPSPFGGRISQVWLYIRTGWPISVLLQKHATGNSFTRASYYSRSSKGHTSTTVWQKISSVPVFLQPAAIDKEPESNAKMYANQMAWRDGANLKAHISSRAFTRKIPVLGGFCERRFQPLSVGGFFSNQRELIIRCPKSIFPSKTQNRQIARTSPLTLNCHPASSLCG